MKETGILYFLKSILLVEKMILLDIMKRCIVIPCDSTCVLLFDLENMITWWLIRINHVSTKSDDVSNIDTIPRLKAEEIGKSLDEDHISFVQFDGEKKPPLHEMLKSILTPEFSTARKI